MGSSITRARGGRVASPRGTAPNTWELPAGLACAQRAGGPDSVRQVLTAVSQRIATAARSSGSIDPTRTPGFALDRPVGRAL
jgi:hypothetical protein